MKNVTDLLEWQALQQHHCEIANQSMSDWFFTDPQRFQRFSLHSEDILLDYSRHRVIPKTMELLVQLANAINLSHKIENLFTGQAINNTEKCSALHTALRDQQTTLNVNGENIAPLIQQSQHKMINFTNKIHSKSWKGVTGKAIQHIVTIGIGGSYTGSMMCTHALKHCAVSPLHFYFISTVDSSHIHDVLQQIDPESTLFIISSKSFSTLETLLNANTILTWMKNQYGHEMLKHHFIAITAHKEKAVEFGIPAENIFLLWNWVGGRYSIWSAIGLPLMLMIGEKQFKEFLAGAYAMDQHFRYADFRKNMPVILALLGIWYLNFFDCTAHAIIPYSYALRYLIPYLQQTEMESNGKRNKLNGKEIYYRTSPVIFGEEGCNGQHTYHQLLHQGTSFIPADFILLHQASPIDKHHDILIASALAQTQALLYGKTYDEAYQELIAMNYPAAEACDLAHHRVIPGNRPCSILLLKQLNPKNLGALLALYEHKIFVQGAIWGINSFDQWGVELGKQLLPNILQQIRGQQSNKPVNPAITSLLNHFKEREPA